MKTKSKGRKTKDSVKKRLGIGAIILIFSVITLMIAFSGINLSGVMISGVYFFHDLFGNAGIYLGVLIISIFGNFTVILPVPYLIAILGIVLALQINPLVIALFAGVGATIGEVTAYFIGRGSHEIFTNPKTEKNILALKRMVENGLAMPLIFLFAATPLPDDILLLILGFMEYSLIRTIIACFLGKLVLVSVVALSAGMLKGTAVSEGILNFYGLTINDGGEIIAGSNPLIPAISIILTILIIYGIIKIDWVEVHKKFKVIFKWRKS